MAHIHSVYDNDQHFLINPLTRAIVNQEQQKTTLIQYDHNSERFTFEIPRFIDGHDMSTCNVVEVHYLNVEAKNTNQNAGVYRVDDLQIAPDDENVVILSWLISQNATQFIGSLNFLIRFSCVTDGNIDYSWNTSVYSNITISTGIYNSEIIVEQYADVLEQWKNELIESGGGNSSVIYTIDYNGTDKSIIDTFNLILNETKPFTVMIKDAHYLMHAQGAIKERGTPYVNGIYRDNVTEVKYTIMLNTSTNVVTRTKKPYGVSSAEIAYATEIETAVYNSREATPSAETTINSINATTSLTEIKVGQVIIIKFSKDQLLASQVTVNLINESGDLISSAPTTGGLYFLHIYYAGDHIMLRYNGTTWDFLNTKTAGSLSIKAEDNYYCGETVESAIYDIDQRIKNCESGTGGGSLNITDDGNGNVTITASGGVSITDDGNGNVVIE